MPQILIPILSIFALIFAFKKLRKNTRETLAGKKVMLFGPPMSGKTTFLNWLVKDELLVKYTATGSGEYKEVLDKDKKTIYTLCDMGGSPGFLTGGVMEKNTWRMILFSCFSIMPNTLLIMNIKLMLKRDLMLYMVLTKNVQSKCCSLVPTVIN